MVANGNDWMTDGFLFTFLLTFHFYLAYFPSLGSFFGVLYLAVFSFEGGLLSQFLLPFLAFFLLFYIYLFCHSP